ncbi:MAG: hypothetical protein GX780_01495 [Campylobacteraceae bacterium]|nr:hypothetical protein [Campylobacteraceae bacterium]
MVLLDKEHLDIAEWERSKSHINKYTLISETCPCESSLEDFAKFSRFKEGFLEDKSRIYGFLPLFNIDATPLGYLGVALQKNKIFHGNQILKIDQESILPMLSITSSKTSKTKIDIR